jgi:site-specific DNA-methyltransferase (adenine-specific)
MENNIITLYEGDCLELMKQIPDKSIDAIITDPPYGTTACKWDSIIDFKLMWEQLNRIIKPNGAIVLFGSEPFSSALRMSNINNYKYDWIWEKNKASNFMGAKYSPMKYHEIVSVFSNKKHNYFPIKWEQKESMIDKRKTFNSHFVNNETHIGSIIRNRNIDDGSRFPKSIIKIDKKTNGNLHPTQKPVPLMEYLIKTYTNEGETVLDFTMGSGTTGVACINTNRNFIGIEKDDNYFKIAKKRIDDAKQQEKEKLKTSL